MTRRAKGSNKRWQCPVCHGYNITNNFNLDPEKPLITICKDCGTIISQKFTK